MKLFRQLFSNPRLQLALCGLAMVVIVAATMAWKSGMTLAGLMGAWGAIQNYLRENPWALFLALVILPGLPIPTSALLLTAGIVWGDRPVTACLLSLFALLLNQSWTYWVASSPGRQLVEKLLATTSIKIPEVSRGDHLRLILLMRLTPGIPLFLQNYLLGFIRVPFCLYLPISFVCTGVIATGLVLSGAGLSEGQAATVATGISLIILAAILTHFIRTWLANRKKIQL
jgi:uncharacterized membrane protein YdjX (TVP38/TMEM64 family)